MSTQRERFEAAWYKQQGNQPIYEYRSDSDAFKWFQLGEASGMERMNSLCDDAWAMALQSDLENGVRSLNEAAAKELTEKFPELAKLGETIRALIEKEKGNG